MENKPSTGILRVLVIGGIVIILIFLSIGIVRIIPRAINALASASVSIGSLFSPSNNATTTNTGFIVSTSTPSQSSNNNATSGTITISDIVRPATSTQPTSSYTPSYSTTPSNTTSPSYSSTNTNYANGTPDLAVTIISRGITNRTTGQYIETNNFTVNDTVIVKFKIENRGTAPTGIWNLRVNMPASNSADRTRSSNGNPSIPAGAAVTGQAIFDQPASGSNTVFNVAVEMQNSSRETNQSNNVATTYFNVSGYGGNTGNTGYQPDLNAQIIAVGVLDTYNNFVVTNNPRVYDRVAIKFRVTNNGNPATGSWNFQINFGNGQTFTSNESGIPGNTSLTYIVGLQNVQQGYNSVNIYLDSGNNVSESNEGNNYISTNFTASY